MASSRMLLLVCLAALILLPGRAHAFGAGNIASVSNIEGHNWRHGDIEDMLKTVAFLRGHKWTSMMIKRAYFGNWLRDYSQAIDVGTLKGVQADTIRVLVWVLAFMSFGYATAEFEVTSDRLGVYRPEEHIDNPKDYADNVDARQYDQRLRGPVMPTELAIDPNTGMKNYIANETGDWSTSLGYIKYSFARSMHFGRLYTHGAQGGKEEDLCEALRCLGQGLHCMEDFGAHTNYTELSLRELGYQNVFPHVGAQTMINLHGKQVFPLVTGTFGGVDFLHSVLGEATDHVTQSEVNQSEVDQMNNVLSQAAEQTSGKRSAGDPASRASEFTNVLAQVPGTGGLIQEAVNLQAASDAQAAENERVAGAQAYDSSYTPYGNQYGGNTISNSGAPSFPGPPGSQGGPLGPDIPGTPSNPGVPSFQRPPGSQGGPPGPGVPGPPSTTGTPSFQAPPGSQGGPPGPGVPGVNVNIDPQQAIAKIYPLLAFRDRVVRTIAGIVSRIPGLEKAIETISEKVTLFIMGLLAPYVKPIIAAASNALKQGSGTVVDASAQQQYLVWADPTSTDPTHSMLSKDHFSNILNSPSGEVAAVILRYVAPRIIYGWDHPEVPEQEILSDIGRVFHHPAIRDQNLEVHREMFAVVEKWARSRPQNEPDLNMILSSESVKAGKNHTVQNFQQSVGGLENQLQSLGTSSHSATAGGPLASFLGGGRRDMDFETEMTQQSTGYGGYESGGYSQPPQPAGFTSGDANAYSTAYQQGYEAGYDPSQQQQQAYSGSDEQQQPQGYEQGDYGGGYNQGYGQGGQGGYGRY